MKNWLKTRWIKLITIVGFTDFTTKDGSWRVSGYYFQYKTIDGDRRLIPCPKLLANTIGGSGVCGWYIYFHEVDSIQFRFKKCRWWFFKRSLNRWKRYRSEWKRLWFFLRLPKGLTEDDILDRVVTLSMKSMGIKK